MSGQISSCLLVATDINRVRSGTRKRAYKLTSLLLLGQGGTSNMVPFWNLSGHINNLTSKKILLTAPQKLIAKLFGQQPVNFELYK